jgi:hypothetical protein
MNGGLAWVVLAKTGHIAVLSLLIALSCLLSVPANAQTTPSYRSLQNQPGVVDAAWCITKQPNNRIGDKSMSPPSVCPIIVSKAPVIWGMSEHRMGRYALTLACVGDVDNLIGPISSALGWVIPSTEDAAIAALAVCQCHDPSAIVSLQQNRTAVLKALREWGGCAGTSAQPTRQPAQSNAPPIGALRTNQRAHFCVTTDGQRWGPFPSLTAPNQPCQIWGGSSLLDGRSAP